MRRTTNTNKGFTLIELVVVIVILGILAATALPKFVDLGKDARIASVRSLRGAIETAAREGYALCKLSPSTCSENATTSNPTEVTGNYVIRPGFALPLRFHWGFPIGWDDYPTHTTISMGIGNLVNYTGFTRPVYISGELKSYFNKDGAPDPTNCTVVYDLSNASVSKNVSVTTIETGC